jgi:hypothetical protein
MKLKRKFEIVGEIKAELYQQDNPVLKAYNSILRRLNSLGLISRQQLAKLYRRGELKTVKVKNNIICNAGFNAMLKALADRNDTTEITEMALGDGVGTPLATDTALFNEVYRNERASFTLAGRTLILTAFYTEDEIDGTFREFGNFVEDVHLWSKVQINWVKPDTQTLTVQCTYTVSNA